jgi:flagella basal body P-ring formation protein FlgA
MKVQLRLISLLSVYFLTPYTLATEFQSHASLYAAAREFIDSNLDANTEHETAFSLLDPRLQLHRCEQPLETFSSSQVVKPGRNAIGVKCSAVNGWSLYILAQVKVYQNVLTLTQPLQRGEILTEQHLHATKMDISQLRMPFIRDINAAVHKQATHNLIQGAILNERDVKQAILIKRGDNVVISSANPYLSIQMQGLALMDGGQGQSIRIKNISSGRIISAIVTKQGTVSVDL